MYNGWTKELSREEREANRARALAEIAAEQRAQALRGAWKELGPAVALNLLLEVGYVIYLAWQLVAWGLG